MISDKVLILFPYEININNGGPSGFLAHNLLDKPRDCFVLSQDIIKTHLEKITKKIDYIIKRILFLLEKILKKYLTIITIYGRLIKSFRTEYSAAR